MKGPSTGSKLLKEPLPLEVEEQDSALSGIAGASMIAGLEQFQMFPTNDIRVQGDETAFPVLCQEIAGDDMFLLTVGQSSLRFLTNPFTSKSKTGVMEFLFSDISTMRHVPGKGKGL
jgi:hypothetical protein